MRFPAPAIILASICTYSFDLAAVTRMLYMNAFIFHLIRAMKCEAIVCAKRIDNALELLVFSCAVHDSKRKPPPYGVPGYYARPKCHLSRKPHARGPLCNKKKFTNPIMLAENGRISGHTAPSRTLCRSQGHLDSIPTAQRQGQALDPHPAIRVPALQLGKLLGQPDRHETRLGQRVLLAQANAWTAVEWKILPARPKALPALGLVFLGVRSVEIGPSVHRKGGVAHDGSAGYEERSCTVGATADGEDGVFYRVTAVAGHDGVCAQSCCHRQALC